jgi:hypothetical protein
MDVSTASSSIYTMNVVVFDGIITADAKTSEADKVFPLQAYLPNSTDVTCLYLRTMAACLIN